jgi:hypothetical protein
MPQAFAWGAFYFSESQAGSFRACTHNNNFKRDTMQVFKNLDGVEYKINVNVLSLETVKSSCGIDLATLFTEGSTLLADLFENPSTLCSVLWVLCGTPDGDKAAFLRSMGGDSLEQAASALVEEVISFIPNQRKQEMCRAAIAKLWQVVNAAQDLAFAELASLDIKSAAAKRVAA